MKKQLSEPASPDEVLYDLKRFKESAEAYGEGIVHFPEDCKLYYGHGLARNQSGDKKGACEDWKKSSALGCFEANALLPLCKDCETKTNYMYIYKV